MNWDAIGAVGEIIGALAVVVSLVYLAIQVRTSNRLARVEAYRTPNSDLNALNAAFGTDGEFRRAFALVLEGKTRDELDVDQRSVVDPYLTSVTNIYEQLAREAREGILRDDELRFGGRFIFSLPYYRSSWPFYKQVLSQAFVEELEKTELKRSVSVPEGL